MKYPDSRVNWNTSHDDRDLLTKICRRRFEWCDKEPRPLSFLSYVLQIDERGIYHYMQLSNTHSPPLNAVDIS
jgi:hypothetical protein